MYTLIITSFFFHYPTVSEISTLSLHDALPILVPPFEGPDELFFYTEARRFAEHPDYRENLLYRLGAPIDTTGFRDKDRKSTRLNSSHVAISYAVFCLKKKNTTIMKMG